MSITTYQPKRRTFQFNLGKTAVYIILILGSFIAMLPFIWMILAAFKTGQELRQIPPTFLPQEWTLDNFRTIFNDEDLPLLTFYGNSAFVALMNTTLVLFTSSLFGFIFAKYDFRGKKTIFWFILATMMIPFQVMMIPSYLILVKLGLLNSLWGLVVGSAVDAFGIFLITQFAKSIPNELLDAARVDGASEWRIYWKIALPQLGPAMATLGMLTFMFNWNSYLWPLIVLTEQQKRTLPIILNWYSTQHSTQIHLTMAASVLVVVPILIVFLAMQKWIVKGISLTGLK
ncbi:MAG: carbohydrate ABC transporter permease [Chloroflexi bacterium]|nr:MAG: carbohydrate ABC transporter permease [Chloroflexota bacterium]